MLETTRDRSRLVLAILLASSVWLTGCTDNLDKLLQQAGALAAGGKQVAVVVVDSEGHVYPKTVIVRQNVHAILWYAAADKLDIPFPIGVVQGTCAGPVCMAAVPPAGTGAWEYNGTVTKGATTKSLDPRLEVVP
jgi:hypothetical protein